MSEIEGWKFFAGLGLFLFSMLQIEDALKSLAGRPFKKLIQKYTTSPLLGILNGILATALLQSSSVVTLMVLTFVGAEILSLSNALGIILGANLGTTFTGWIVASLGFKVELTTLILPMLAIGCCGMVFFGKRFRAYHLLLFLTGLALLLMGLDFMKESMEAIARGTDPSFLRGYGIAVFFAFGFIFTAIIQSSSATMMIALSALSAGILTLNEGAALVVGADLGTTMTAAIGAFKGSVVKRRVAAAHFIFNLVTDVIALYFLADILNIVVNTFSIKSPLYSLVAFHSSFNIIGIFLFFPFLKKFEKFLQGLWTKESESVSKVIKKLEIEPADAALVGVRQEIELLLIRVFHFIQLCLGAKPLENENHNGNLVLHLLFSSQKEISVEYDKIKRLEGEILSFLMKIQRLPLDEEEVKQMQNFILVIRHGVQSAKAIKDISHNIREFESSVEQDIFDYEIQLSKSYSSIQDQMLKALQSGLIKAQPKTLELLIQSNENAYAENNHWVYQELGQEPGLASHVATFLNVNKEIYSSHKYLAMAMEDLEKE